MLSSQLISFMKLQTFHLVEKEQLVDPIVQDTELVFLAMQLLESC